MAVEIERKFLVADERWRQAAGEPVQLEQGYLGGDRCSTLVRTTDLGETAPTDETGQSVSFMVTSNINPGLVSTRLAVDASG